MAHTTKHIAAQEKDKAQKKLDHYKKIGLKNLNAAQKAKFEASLNTKRTANIAIKNATKAERIVKNADSPAEAMRLLKEARDAEIETRGGLLADTDWQGKQFGKGGAFDYGLAAQAFGDQMRKLTGRQMGQGTSYTGPGVRVAIDAEGDIQRDDQGRVMYEVDPTAYAKRFRPAFQPTAEQETMWKELFPDSEHGITSGNLTPWQQVNLQWMTGSKDDQGKLLSDLGIAPTEENLGLFYNQLKEGKIPKEFREAWAAKFDKAKQLERYKGGYFNPTTGKLTLDPQGNIVGEKAQWGTGTGLIHPEDFVPEGWTGPLPVPGAGVTGTPTGIFAPTRTRTRVRVPAGGAGRNWDRFMPKGVFAGSEVQPTQAMRGLVAGQGLQYQPWAIPERVGKSTGAPFVPQTVQYNPQIDYNPAVSTETESTTTTTTDNGVKTYGPGGMYDNYQDWYMSAQNPTGHYWALQNANANSPWTNKGTIMNPNWTYNAAASITPTVTTAAEDVTDTTTNFGYDPDLTHHF